MATSFESFQKKRLQSSYISVIISIALVLFMTGLLGLVILKSNQVANHFKEELVMSIFIKDDVTKKDLESFRDSILGKEYTKTLYYITKKEAAMKYQDDLGENFLDFLGENPLKNGIDLYINAKYVTIEQMKKLEKEFLEKDIVFDVSYDKPLLEQLSKNIKRVSFWLLMLSIFFGLIAILLINSSIRLSIYSKRFNIKTMQMVGATKKFIRKPFIIQSIKLGLIGSVLAIIALGILVFYINKFIPSLSLIDDYLTIAYTLSGIIILAVGITWFSTFFATQKFLKLNTNDLYY